MNSSRLDESSTSASGPKSTDVAIDAGLKKIKHMINIGSELFTTERSYVEMARVFSKMVEFGQADKKLPATVKELFEDMSTLNLEILQRSPINNLSFEQTGISATEVESHGLKRYVEVLVNNSKDNPNPLAGNKILEQVVDDANQFDPNKLMAIDTKFYGADEASLYVIDKSSQSIRKATEEEIKDADIEKISVREAKKKIDQFKLKIIKVAIKTIDTDEMIKYMENMALFAKLYSAVQPHINNKNKDANKLQDAYVKKEQSSSANGIQPVAANIPNIETTIITHVQRIPRYTLLINEIRDTLSLDKKELELGIDPAIESIDPEIKTTYEALPSLSDRIKKAGALANEAMEVLPDPLIRVFLALYAAIAKIPDVQKRDELMNKLLALQVKKLSDDDKNSKRLAFERAAEEFAMLSQEINLDASRQKYIEKNIAKFGVRMAKKQQAEEPIKLTEVKLPVLHLELKEDKHILKTFEGMKKAQARLDILNAKGKLGLLAGITRDYYSKKMRKYNDKLAYINQLNEIAKDYYNHIKNKDKVEVSDDAANYESIWQNEWSKDFNKIKDYVPAGFEDRRKELIDKINAIKRNEFDIDKFEKLSKELIKNAAYKHKYKSHNAMFHDLMHDMQETERAKEKNLQDLARLHEELAIDVQKALIEAEKDKTKKILDSEATPLSMQPISGAMKPHFEKYETYVKEANTRLYRRKALHEQGKTQTLKSDIEKYMNPEENNSFFSRLKTKLKYKDVTKAYKEFARDFNQQTNALDLKIAETPHKIKAYHDQLLKVARKEWKKVKGKDLTKRPLAEQTKLMSQVCLMMINIHDTQSALLSQPSKASVVIDKTMYSDLNSLMNGSHLSLVTNHHIDGKPCPYREKLLEIMKTDGFKSAPKEVRNMVKKLNKVVKHNYEPQTKSWFFKKKPDKQVATKQDRVFNQAPPEINDDEIHGSRRNSRSSF